MYSHKDLYMNVIVALFKIVQNLKHSDIQMVNELNVVYLYNGILFNNKKEWSTDKWYNMNESEIGEAKKPDAKDYMLITVVWNV